ncbi:MAG: CCA tRNA nucleotidyltransferase, partial [Phycisphaeraceae bacterium]|nr:CCA tRNA nucleotidyltransferase [Phycisphaeraceae bacterium]
MSPPERPQQPPPEPSPAQPGRLAAVAVVEVLQRAGHVAYLAGGCVRDELLGVTPQDWDVATDATPDRVRALFKVSRYVGQAFGVVLVRVKRHWVEVATFRTEGVYLDGRHPSEVAFADAERDARRRDFTINGLFEDPLEPDPAQRVKDGVGGVNDLHRRLIRAIGDPEARFSEDYLRMLRAVRFAARLGFQIESRTAGAIIARASRLSQISRERIGQEIQWTLTGPRPALAVWWIERLGLAGPCLME